MMARRCFALCAALLFAFAAWADPAPRAPEEHRRTPDQTFLTFPEWYLVHSPAEYAAYLSAGRPASGFPLYSHIGQFWQAYAAVVREIEKYPFNGGYHLMVMVIGVSTTVEYGLKETYERTIGRLFEATKSGSTVPEEGFAARYAQAYVDFIRIDPWYKFDFWSRLKELWAEVPLMGPDLPRRWERRFALTSELLVKEGYARLIKLGTGSIYDAPKPVTAVVLSRPAPADPARHPDLQLLDKTPRPDGSQLVLIPRYEGFTTYSLWLASEGIDFREIAGNEGEIVLSYVVPDTWRAEGVRLLFEQPILTQPGRKRVVFAAPVATLGAQLRHALASSPQVVVEHVYDF
jgi:hypothetical protein